MLKKLVIVQIAGKAGQGKTTTKNEIMKELLVNHPMIQVRGYSYGAKVKEIANETLTKMGINVEKTDKELIRPMYQIVGMMARDVVDKDHWLKQVAIQIKGDYEFFDLDVAIIDDARFVNEIEYFDDKYETIKIKMDRPSAIKHVNPDSSETGLDKYKKSNYDLFITDAYDPKQINKILDLIIKKGNNHG